MVDVTIGYDGLTSSAGRLKAEQGEIDQRLLALKSMIDALVEGEFHTQLASGRFHEAYQQWTSGAQTMIQGLEGMAGFLGEVVSAHQELDGRLAQGAGS